MATQAQIDSRKAELTVLQNNLSKERDPVKKKVIQADLDALKANINSMSVNEVRKLVREELSKLKKNKLKEDRYDDNWSNCTTQERVATLNRILGNRVNKTLVVKRKFTDLPEALQERIKNLKNKKSIKEVDNKFGDANGIGRAKVMGKSNEMIHDISYAIANKNPKYNYRLKAIDDSHIYMWTDVAMYDSINSILSNAGFKVALKIDMSSEGGSYNRYLITRK